jgi:pyruvate formate lyase activating enzyme
MRRLFGSPRSDAHQPERILHLQNAACAKLEAAVGVITDIQRYSLHDGPGLRTSVFLKGCSLHCAWCANPETQTPHPELAVFSRLCIQCGQFEQACPDGWTVRHDDRAWRRDVQTEYDRRAALCPAGGVRWIGEWRAAGSVMDEVRRDAPFYQDDGGLTLTGGEPALQPDFAEAVLRLACDEGIHTAIETCGHAPWPNLARLLPYLDVVLFDVKHMDSEVHLAFTGAGNELILDNLLRLADAGAPVVVRVPLIPGFSAAEESVRAIGRFVAGLPRQINRVDLLPYHTLGRAKYAALAQHYSWEGVARLAEEEVEELADVLRGMGLAVTVGG